MPQSGIPYLFMHNSTSRGPYFNSKNLPQDQQQLAEVLMAVVGAGNPRNIDGIGGGNAVTTKVAMLSRSAEDGVDIDYFFAQVAVEERLVDFSPTCGNILVGVGPAAIEMGLVPVTQDQTKVRIRAVNTGALVEAVVQTPKGQVEYAGDVSVDGVPGTAAPVGLNFMHVVGSRTGKLFPTDKPREQIAGHEVSCVDVAMPMVIARADSFNITGHESQEELDNNPQLFEQMEQVRREAGLRMGFGDVAKSVVPKFGLVAKAQGSGHFAARYFMPWTTHPTLAVTGSQCLAACALAPGTVAEGLVRAVDTTPATISIEHPMGEMDVVVDFDINESGLDFRSAGVVRTARLIARGEVLVAEELLAGVTKS